jgi:hypothetical protein
MALAASCTARRESCRAIDFPCSNAELVSCTLKQDFRELEQPWYADHAGVTGKFDDIHLHFCKLQEIGPIYGYFPELTKSILIVPKHNLERPRLLSKQRIKHSIDQSLEGTKFWCPREPQRWRYAAIRY